jgi:hypothetical protein
MADDLNFEFNLASDWGLPSRYFSISLVKLLTHRCTIACDVSTHRQSNTSILRQAFSGSPRLKHLLLLKSKISTSPSFSSAFQSLVLRQAFSGSPRLKHSFLWHFPPAHAVRSFSGNLSLDARTFLICLHKRDYPTAF